MPSRAQVPPGQHVVPRKRQKKNDFAVYVLIWSLSNVSVYKVPGQKYILRESLPKTTKPFYRVLQSLLNLTSLHNNMLKPKYAGFSFSISEIGNPQLTSV
jgi:hypothetical protein